MVGASKLLSDEELVDKLELELELELELRDVVSAIPGSACIPSRRYKLKVMVPEMPGQENDVEQETYL
jgi:hypothetical protein